MSTRVRITCGLCGPVEFSPEGVFDAHTPATQDEADTLVSLVLTLHQIRDHLDEVEQ